MKVSSETRLELTAALMRIMNGVSVQENVGVCGVRLTNILETTGKDLESDDTKRLGHFKVYIKTKRGRRVVNFRVCNEYLQFTFKRNDSPDLSYKLERVKHFKVRTGLLSFLPPARSSVYEAG